MYFILVNIFFPIRNVFSFDTDEGINLIKSLLLLKGYPLYSEIWSDQPPLLTYILAGTFNIFGMDVNVGRMVILVFAAILVWAFTQYLLVISNRWCALIGLLLLVVLPYYIQLSVSVMVGLPAIALGVVSLLFVTLWHQTKHNVWLVVAGAVLALSMLIKLITGFLLPIFFLGIFIDEYFSNKQKGYKRLHLPSLVLFCISFVLIILVGIVFWVKPSNVSQLIFTHASNYKIYGASVIAAMPFIVLAAILVLLVIVWRRTKRVSWWVIAGTIFGFSVVAGIIFFIKLGNGIQLVSNLLSEANIKEFFRQAFVFVWFFNKILFLLVLAIIGSIRVIKTKRLLAFYAIAWGAAGCVFLCVWRPVWYHHFMLFTIPAAFLASLAFVDAESVIRQSFLTRGYIGIWQWIRGLKRYEWKNLFVMLLFILNWGLMLKILFSDVQKINTSLQQPNGENQISNELMSKIMVYAPKMHYMVTDLPIFAFKANVPTPPYLAVISHKRIWSGELTKAQIGETILQWKPEMVLFGGKINPAYVINNYVTRHYTLIYSNDPWKLYVLNELSTQSSP